MEKRICGCGLRPKSREERNIELRRDAARIVADVENYSSADHVRRSEEVFAAFPPAAGKAVTGRAAAKTATKGTTAKASAITKTTAKASAAKKATAKPAAKKSTPKPVAKTASRGPATAGMSVGPHDGDLC